MPSTASLAEAAAVAVRAASRPLALVLDTDPVAETVLESLDSRVSLPTGGDVDDLVRWKGREWLRIAARDLLGLDDVAETGAEVAHMADVVLREAVRIAEAGGIAVIGMGKLGGVELNYASDVDILFVADDGLDPAVVADEARRTLRVAASCFRVDTNLRPEGRNGPLARSLASYEAYWDRWAAPWEFQALLKARAIVGPDQVPSRFETAVAERLWSRRWTADDLRSVRQLKARSEALAARRGHREVKRSAGGIRDIEFAVQLLQLVHGRSDPELRVRSTLEALDHLGTAGYVDHEDADGLARSYRFLRRVEHLAQLREGLQTHAVPADADARDRLARALGLEPAPGASAADVLDDELAQHRALVRRIYEGIWFRPLLEAFDHAIGGPLDAVVEERLVAFGFADTARTREAVRELTRGLTRTSRLMDQFLPLLLTWLADSPDPDRGLLGLRTLATGRQRAAELARAFRESPETARRLCLLTGTSSLLTGLLEHNPDLVPALGEALGERSAAELRELLADAGPRLRHIKDREVLRIGATDVLDGVEPEVTCRQLAALADATVGAALELVGASVPMAVFALGRLGAGRLSYASDLDVLLVHAGGAGEMTQAAEAAATSFVHLLDGPTPARRIWEVDLRLRPEGRQGALTRSVNAWAAYLERWAQPWERLALVHARPVAGNPEVLEAFGALLASWVWDRELPTEEVRELQRIKARVEIERVPVGQDPAFHLKLGRGSLSDIEFTVGLLQLRTGVRAGGILDALDALVDAGALEGADAETLASAYRVCERIRLRLQLVSGGQGDSLPNTGPDLTRLARALGTTPVALREEYRRTTRRARAVVERVFYGRNST